MAVKGAILGDILGAPYEGRKPGPIDWMNIPLVPPNIKLYFTDDTVMTLAVKKAIHEQRDYTEVMVELGRKYPDCGYGEYFCDWLESNEHLPYNSWGNGSAMRISFISEYYDDHQKVHEEAVKSAMVSHNHPEGVKGAVVTATCIWMARKGKSKTEIYDYVLEQYPRADYEYSISYSLDEIRERYKWNASCQGSVPAAMRCFYESHDYESFIRNIISLECDADTFGAIAGGVAEEFYHGFGGINAEKILKECLTDDLYTILIM